MLCFPLSHELLRHSQNNCEFKTSPSQQFTIVALHTRPSSQAELDEADLGVRDAKGLLRQAIEELRDCKQAQVRKNSSKYAGSNPGFNINRIQAGRCAVNV